jgi:hypothetical protein
VRGRTWYQGNSFHNAVIVRNASSFAKFLPRLVLRFARIPAMMGGVVVGGYAWIHYQATRMSLDKTSESTSMIIY